MSKNKIDWVIHAIKEDNGKICLHTHGLNEKGLTELSVLDTEEIYSAEDMAAMMNNIASMMIEGEKFIVDKKLRRIINNPDGSPRFSFTMSYAKCYGEKTIRLNFRK